MKRTAFAIIVILAVIVLAAPAAAASRNDFKVIQSAVKNSPKAEAAEGREVRWFKVLITDGRVAEPQIRITLPVALIELILASSDSRHFRVDDEHCDIDLKAVWAALKAAGPMALVQIEDDGAIIKVWLE